MLARGAGPSGHFLPQGVTTRGPLCRGMSCLPPLVPGLRRGRGDVDGLSSVGRPMTVWGAVRWEA